MYNILSFSSVIILCHGINIISFLIFGNILGPEKFGIYAKIISLSVIISMFNTLKLDLTLYENKEILRRRNHNLLIIVTISITLLLLLLSIVLKNNDYLLAVLLAASTQLINFEFIKLVLENEFKKLNKLRLIQALLNLFIPLILLIKFNDPIIIVISNFSMNFLLYIICKNNSKLVFKKYTISKLIIYVKKYQRYIKYTCPAEVIGSISAYIPILFIEKNFSMLFLGLFTMALRISYTPIGLVSKSIGEYFRASLTKKNKKESNVILYILIILAALLFIILNYIDDNIIFYFLDESWEGIAELLNIMSLFVAIKLFASTISFILFHYKKNHIDLIWQIINLIGVLIICLYSVNFINLMKYFSNFSFIMYMILSLICLRLYLNDKNN